MVKPNSMSAVILKCRLIFDPKTCIELHKKKNILESLFHLFSKVENHQVQIASTESFFITCGHGSPPKIPGDTVTVHEL